MVVRWGWLGIWVCSIAFSWDYFPEAHHGPDARRYWRTRPSLAPESAGRIIFLLQLLRINLIIILYLQNKLIIVIQNILILFMRYKLISAVR